MSAAGPTRKRWRVGEGKCYVRHPTSQVPQPPVKRPMRVVSANAHNYFRRTRCSPFHPKPGNQRPNPTVRRQPTTLNNSQDLPN